MIMEICKAPTLRLKALNKYSITHIMYIEMEVLSAIEMYIRKRRRKFSVLNHICSQMVTFLMENSLYV